MSPTINTWHRLQRAYKAFAGIFRTTGKVDQPELAAARAPRRRPVALHAPHHVDPDDDFLITAITWLAGQKSPAHGYYVWCAYGVVEGELSEETFRAPGALLEPTGSRMIRAGELADIDLGGPLYHRVSNPSRNLLVTPHVYGVAADRLTTSINRLYGEE